MENLTASPNPPCRTRKGPGRGARFALAAPARGDFALSAPDYADGNFRARTQAAANQPRLFADPPPDARRGGDRWADDRQGRLRLPRRGRRMDGATGESVRTAAAVALLVVVRRRGGLRNGARRIRARRRGGMLRMLNGGRGRRGDEADSDGPRQILFACPVGRGQQHLRRAVARVCPLRPLAGESRPALVG